MGRFVERTLFGGGAARRGCLGGCGVRRASSRAGGRRLLERCTHRTQDKFAIVSMAKKFLHCCIGAHSRVLVHFFCGGHTVYRLMVCPLWRGCAWMWVLMSRDQHASARTFCVCLAAGSALAAKKMACIDSRHFLLTCTHVCAVYSFSVGGKGWESSASL